MTEGEWLTCDDPAPMLAWLGDGSETIRTRWQGAVAVRRWRTSERKLWLYAVAVGRSLADELLTDAGHRMLDGLEEWADGDLGAGELVRLINQQEERETTARRDILQAPALHGTPLQSLTGLCRHTTRFHLAWSSLPLAEQAGLLREVVGNPFRPPAIDPLWLAANDGAVRRMAEEMARLRDFRHLSILADALEDAGCTDEAILAHCRTPAGHVRGCWVIDALLGRS